MIDIKQEILTFLTDSKNKCGELAYELAMMRRNGIEDQRSYIEKRKLLFELIAFNDTLEVTETISDPQFAGLNNYMNNRDHLQIIKDLHFWRNRGNFIHINAGPV